MLVKGAKGATGHKDFSLWTSSKVQDIHMRVVVPKRYHQMKAFDLCTYIQNNVEYHILNIYVEKELPENSGWNIYLGIPIIIEIRISEKVSSINVTVVTSMKDPTINT